uniref:Chromosome 1 open reading frame 198 n=1 Tax=Chelydra serpentina TaxID=8475 RepID=A0A8C3XRM8_CHESE
MENICYCSWSVSQKEPSLTVRPEVESAGLTVEKSTFLSKLSKLKMEFLSSNNYGTPPCSFWCHFSEYYRHLTFDIMWFLTLHKILISDITWQDEHSAPFSWETKSQMEFSVASLSIQEQGSQNEQRQLVKAALGVQAPKSQSNKAPSSDGLIPARKEEESSFWKINAERSKVEGEQSEFQSLTPSQIKSMEKGEKSLPTYYRQESAPKETTKAEKSSIAKQEKCVTPSLPATSLEWEKPRPSQPSTSTLDDIFLPEQPEQLASAGSKNEAAEVEKINTSNVILKTGFDFLDNW